MRALKIGALSLAVLFGGLLAVPEAQVAITRTVTGAVQRIADGQVRIFNDARTNTFDLTVTDWGAILSGEAVTVADNAVLFLGAALNGLLVVANQTDNSISQFGLRGSTNATTMWLGDGAVYTITKDNASTINIYYDAAGPSGAGYYLQNKRGGSRVVRLVLIGS